MEGRVGEMGRCWSKGKLPVMRQMSWGNLTFSRVTIVNSTVLST